MAKIVKDSKGKFLKGVCTNPNGRPKGAVNEITRRYAIIKHLAAERADKAFELLWDAMENKEPWAFQIYFKELFHLPKNYGEKTVILEKKERTVNGQIKVLTEVLSEFDEVTQGESLERLKVLNSLKHTENTEIQIEEVRESKESLREKVALIDKILAHRPTVEAEQKGIYVS